MTRKANKKEKLLDAAAEAFWVNGYDSTSLADIAKNSGVPLGNIYYYFKTKAAIADGVAEIFVFETKQSLDTIELTHTEATDKLRAFVNLLRESAESRARLGCPLASGIRDFSGSVPTALQKTNEVFEIIYSWLTQVLEEAGDKKAERHARTILAHWQGSVVLSHSSGSRQLMLDAFSDLEEDVTSWTRQLDHA